MQFKITPDDSWQEGVSGIIEFHLDNNEPPSFVFFPPSPEVTDSVNFAITYSDVEEDNVTYSVSYRTESTAWQEADIEVTSIQNETIYLDWLSLQDIGFSDKLVKLKVEVFDNDPGFVDSTQYFNVDNYHSHTIELSEIGGEQEQQIEISYQIQDITADELSLVLQGSIDGGESWNNIGSVSSINPSEYINTFDWDSYQTFPGIDQASVIVRATVFDQWDDGNTHQVTVQIDNNIPPVASISTEYEEVAGDKTFIISYTDTENDAVTWEYYYSIDFGQSWIETDIEQGPGYVIWHSINDIPNYEFESILFKNIPFDNDVGTEAITDYFSIDNDHSSAEILLESGEYFSVVTIPYQLTDLGGDALSINLEYFYESNWHSAYTIGQTTDITEYTGQIQWNSNQDLNNVDLEEITFRITPNDEWDNGNSDELTIHLDNEVGPQLVTHTENVGLRSPLEFEFDLPIADSDFDNHFTISSLYDNDISNKVTIDRLDNHKILQITTNELLSFTSLDTLSITIHNTLLDTLGKGFDGDGDGDPEFSEVDDKLVKVPTQLISDYDTTGVIDIYDLNQFVSAWFEKDYSYELGPALGTVPNLIPTYDNSFDIEDMATFLRMWNWSDDFAHPLLSAESIGEPAIFYFEGNKLMMELKETDDISAIRFSVSSSESIETDKEILKQDFDIALERVFEDENISEINLAKTIFDRELSDLIICSISEVKTSCIIDVSYEILGLNGVLSSGDESIDYNPIPDEFSLNNAYPNPFNPTTTINYELPTDANVTISVYNIMGQLVTELVSSGNMQDAGYHQITWNADNQPSGLYFVKMTAGNYVGTQKVLLLK